MFGLVSQSENTQAKGSEWFCQDLNSINQFPRSRDQMTSINTCAQVHSQRSGSKQRDWPGGGTLRIKPLISQARLHSKTILLQQATCHLFWTFDYQTGQTTIFHSQPNQNMRQESPFGLALSWRDPWGCVKCATLRHQAVPIQLLARPVFQWPVPCPEALCWGLMTPISRLQSLSCQIQCAAQHRSPLCDMVGLRPLGYATSPAGLL